MLRSVLRSSPAFSLLALLSAVEACGGAGGKGVAPKDFTGADALGVAAGKCTTPKAAEPLLVDLEPQVRGELEVNLKNGLVVVDYDCASLKILTDCKVDTAGYKFAGWSMKSNVVGMKGLDELTVNLPLGASKLGSEVKAGRSIELALLNIGAQSSTVVTLGRERLIGSCEGATHFVKKAFLGAFSLSTSSSGKVSAAADLFGKVGASGKSESERNQAMTEGSIDACKSADADAAKPPAECRVPFRAVLVPIAGAAPEPAKAEPKKEKGEKQEPRKMVADADPCPPGFTLAEGACRKTASTHLCQPKDLAECTEQCSKNDIGSCFNLGVLQIDAEDLRSAKTSFEKACTGGHVDACGGVARASYPPKISRRNLPDAMAALELSKDACMKGSVIGCWDASLYLHDQAINSIEAMRDVNLSLKFSERGCKLGDGDACGTIASDLLEPPLEAKFPKDPVRGAGFMQAGCDAGSPSLCADLGEYLLMGKFGIAKDVERGVRLVRYACDFDADRCADDLNELVKVGKLTDAFYVAHRGCDKAKEMAKVDSCKKLVDFYTTGTATAKDPAAAAAAQERSKEGEAELCAAGFTVWCAKEAPAKEASKPAPATGPKPTPKPTPKKKPTGKKK